MGHNVHILHTRSSDRFLELGGARHILFCGSVLDQYAFVQSYLRLSTLKLLAHSSHEMFLSIL